MDTPISWIKAYVPDLDCTPQEYADKMTLSGSNMESVTYLDKKLRKDRSRKDREDRKTSRRRQTDRLSGECWR